MKKTACITLFLLLNSCGLVKDNKPQAAATKLTWDFSKENTYVYTQQTTISSAYKTTKSAPLLTSMVVENANIIVQAIPNQLADFSISNLKVNYNWFKEDGSLQDSITHNIPTQTLKNITENGDFGGSATANIFKLYMPLPPKNLQKGESFSVPLKFPVEDDPELFNDGVNTITFSGVKTIKGIACAVLKGVIALSKLNVKVHYDQKISGSATYYFDVDQHRFIGADIHMIENSLNELPLKQTEFYTLKSKSQIKIRLAGMDDFLAPN